MAIEQPHFAGLDESVGVFQIYFSVARRLDFSSRQYEAGFEFFEDVVVMKRLTVDCDVLHS